MATGAQERNAVTALCQQIRIAHRSRDDLLRAEKRLTLQIKALCRRACDGSKETGQALYKAITRKVKKDEGLTPTEQHIAIFMGSRSSITAEKNDWEKALVRLTAGLPCAEWYTSIPGCGLLGLGQIVGEAGDLSNYPNPAKLWRRMGLAVTPDGRKALKNVKGQPSVGYSKERCSVMYTIGDAMIKRAGPYRKLYLERKKFEREKAKDEGLTVRPAASITDKNRAKSRSVGHIDRRARRYMAKRLLRDLWCVWTGNRASSGGMVD